MKNTKVLCVKRFGWKRIANNTERFGWIMYDAEEETTITTTTTYEGEIVDNKIYINPKTNRKSKVRVWLSFYRYDRVPLPVKILEFIYNRIFFLRVILAFISPLYLGALIVLGFLQFSIEKLSFGFGFVVLGWLCCILLEGILARIAGLFIRD